MASRYGSMKQVDGFGPNGETIVDYSIYDAIKAGFGKVSFIIQEQHLEVFRNVFEPRLRGLIEVDFVFQSFDPSTRVKPWGTGHALLCARDQIREPFCIINADDFYGYSSFARMADFLKSGVAPDQYALMGYQLGKTLSDHGSVSRGICEIDGFCNLAGITERTKVFRQETGIVYQEADGLVPLGEDTPASMNFWGFHPSVFDHAETFFLEFARDNTDPKAEFYIPYIAERLVASGGTRFKVIPTSESWFGVTYKEDKPFVQACISRLLDQNAYPASLWSQYA